MEIDLCYDEVDFKERIINLPKNIKIVNIVGSNINVSNLCNILEDVKESIIVNTLYNDEIKLEFSKRGTYQGFNRSILNMVKKICIDNVSGNDFVVDMTTGNGNDTLFLAGISKKVFGFDIQSIAINNTNNLLLSNNINNYELFNCSHDNIDKVLYDYIGNIKLILFNLGYLPCGDKSITTMHETTLKAFKNSYKMIKDDGLILIVFYPHPEGKLEEKVILEYLNKENINYNTYRNTLNINAPYLLVIKKMKSNI